MDIIKLRKLSVVRDKSAYRLHFCKGMIIV